MFKILLYFDKVSQKIVLTYALTSNIGEFNFSYFWMTAVLSIIFNLCQSNFEDNCHFLLNFLIFIFK